MITIWPRVLLQPFEFVLEIVLVLSVKLEQLSARADYCLPSWPNELENPFLPRGNLFFTSYVNKSSVTKALGHVPGLNITNAHHN